MFEADCNKIELNSVSTYLNKVLIMIQVVLKSGLVDYDLKEQDL